MYESGSTGYIGGRASAIYRVGSGFWRTATIKKIEAESSVFPEVAFRDGLATTAKRGLKNAIIWTQ
jgi:hypothetical protein